MAGGLWAVVRWSQERKTNGNGHTTNGGSPSEPPPLVLANLAEQLEDSAKSMKLLTGRVADLVERHNQPLVVKDPQPSLEWIAGLEDRLATRVWINAPPPPPPPAFPPELAASLQRVTDRLEALIQMGPPAPPEVDLDPVMEKIDKQTEQVASMERRMASMAKAGGGRPLPPKQSSPLTRVIPHPLPPIPSVPPSYFAGTVNLSGGQPQNLLDLIHHELQPNCPGTGVQLRLTADSEVFVGAASFLGGPLTSSNYGFALQPGEERLYKSAYPGSSVPLGDLQVLGSGLLHVELQL